MKKIMLAAVAASFMTTGAHAIQLPAEGEACSTIHSNISVGINNPELSDYRKCVMIQHDIDTAFTYKTFWVRSGTEFTSFPVETLAKLNRGERTEFIKDVIIKEVIKEKIIEKIVEVQVENTEKIDMLTAQIKVLVPLAESVPTLNTQIAELSADLMISARDLADAIASKAIVTQNYEMAKEEIASLTTKVDQFRDIANINGQNAAHWYAESLRLAEERHAFHVSSDLHEEQRDIARAERDEARAHLLIAQESNRDLLRQNGIRDDRIADLEEDLETVTNQRNDVITDRDFLITGLVTASSDLIGVSKANSLGDGVSSYAHAVAIIDAIQAELDSYTTASTLDVRVLFTDGKAFKYVFKNGDYSTGLIGVEIDAYNPEIPTDLAETAEAAFIQGYDDGFNDGYKQGYQDGYADGFTDGVASVK